MINPGFWVTVFVLCFVGGVVDAVRVYRNNVTAADVVTSDVRVSWVDVVVHGVRWAVVVVFVYVVLSVFGVKVAGATELGSMTGLSTDTGITTAMSDLITTSEQDGTFAKTTISSTSMTAGTTWTEFDTGWKSNLPTKTSDKLQDTMTESATPQSNTMTSTFGCAEKVHIAKAMTDTRDSKIDTCNGYGTINAIEMAPTNSRTDRMASMDTGCMDITIGMRTVRMLMEMTTL